MSGIVGLSSKLIGIFCFRLTSLNKYLSFKFICLIYTFYSGEIDIFYNDLSYELFKN